MKRLHYADWNEVRITLTVKDIADVLNVCDTVALNLVRSGEIPEENMDRALDLSRLNEAAYRSAQSHQPVALDTLVE